MEIDEVRIKMTVVIFDRNGANRKRPLCGRNVYCSLDGYFRTHDMLLQFAERKKKGNKNIGFAINTYVCKSTETV